MIKKDTKCTMFKLYRYVHCESIQNKLCDFTFPYPHQNAPVFKCNHRKHCVVYPFKNFFNDV